MVESTQQKMRSVVLTSPGEYNYSADIKDVPTPAEGEVLIQVVCAPINPTDTHLMNGKYPGSYDLSQKQMFNICVKLQNEKILQSIYDYPLVPGIEGSGCVVKSGGGEIADTLVGQRVSFRRILESVSQFTRGGSYAEYCVTNANNCIILSEESSFEQGANGYINPLTALGLLQTCIDKQAKAVIQTGGNSQVGRMMITLLKGRGIPIISIVRKDEDISSLKQRYGHPADRVYFLNSESSTFQIDLKALSYQLNANVVLECVSGHIFGVIASCLPPQSTMVSYGALSELPISGLNPMLLIGYQLKLEGFMLSTWLSQKEVNINEYAPFIPLLLDEVVINKSFGLHQIHEAMDEYKKNMGAGRVLLKPSLTV